MSPWPQDPHGPPAAEPGLWCSWQTRGRNPQCYEPHPAPQSAPLD